MNIHLEHFEYSPIVNYDYKEHFHELTCEDKTLSSNERVQTIDFINQSIEQFRIGLPMLHEGLARIKQKHDEYHEVDRVILSISMFVLITMIDIMSI